MSFYNKLDYLNLNRTQKIFDYHLKDFPSQTSRITSFGIFRHKYKYIYRGGEEAIVHNQGHDCGLWPVVQSLLFESVNTAWNEIKKKKTVIIQQ